MGATQQKGTLLAVQHLRAHGTFSQILLHELFESPKLPFQMLGHRCILDFEQELDFATGHCVFTIVPAKFSPLVIRDS